MQIVFHEKKETLNPAGKCVSLIVDAGDWTPSGGCVTRFKFQFPKFSPFNRKQSNYQIMRSLLIVLSLTAASSATSFAAAATGTGFPMLPGFDLENGGKSTVSSSELRPAVTFSVAMQGAFLTSTEIALEVTPTNWKSSPTAPRRVRSVIGHASPKVGVDASSPVAAAPAAAVPEPGTFLTGVLLVGFCGVARPRGGRRG